MTFSAEDVFLAVRALSYVISFGFLGGRLGPLSVRLSVGVALFLMLQPILSTNAPGWKFDFSSGLLVGGLSAEVAEHFVRSVAYETAIGLFLGAAASVVIRVAEVFGTWISVMISPAGSLPEDQQQKTPLLSFAFLLLAVELVFTTRGGSALFSYFSQSLTQFPGTITAAGEIKEAHWLAIIKLLGGMAFSQAALIGLPFLIAIVSVDFMFLMAQRFVRFFVNTELFLSGRLVLVVFLLTMMLYPLSQKLLSSYSKVETNQGLASLLLELKNSNHIREAGHAR